MPGIHDLADELLLQIMSFIPPQDFESFATTSRSFYRISYERLQEHKMLTDKYQRLKLTDPIACHKFTMLALQSDIGLYVEEVQIAFTEPDDDDSQMADYVLSDEELKTYRYALTSMEQCGYISRALADDRFESYLDMGLHWKHGFMIALLLPHLQNMRTLCLVHDGIYTSGFGDLRGVMKVVAMSPPNESPPFNKLEAVCFTSSSWEYGFGIHEILDILALPSVRFAIIDCLHVFWEHKDNVWEQCWHPPSNLPPFHAEEYLPIDLPLSHVEVCIFINSSSRIHNSILDKFTAAIEGPCEIIREKLADDLSEQWDDMHEQWDDTDERWDDMREQIVVSRIGMSIYPSKYSTRAKFGTILKEAEAIRDAWAASRGQLS